MLLLKSIKIFKGKAFVGEYGAIHLKVWVSIKMPEDYGLRAE